MSKDKPEVGDVWQSTRSDKTKIYITRITNTIWCITDNGIGSTRYFSKFTVRYKYLGKSKANINELFEVQDER